MPNLDTQTNLVRHFEGLATREPGALLDNELWWRDHYQVLENRGYRLRPRYRPDWVPSWRMSGKNPYTVEDGQPSLVSVVRLISSVPNLALDTYSNGRNAPGRKAGDA